MHVLGWRRCNLSYNNERIVPVLDGFNYRFRYNTELKQIEIHEQRDTVWMANHTDKSWLCEIVWTGDSPNTSYLLEPGKARPHWNPTLAKSKAPYPQIRIRQQTQKGFDNTERFTELKKKRLITRSEFFPVIRVEGPERFSIVQTEEVKHIQTDRKKEIMDKPDLTLQNYYFLEMSPENGLLEVHNGYINALTNEYNPMLTTDKRKRKGWKYWGTFVGPAIVGAIVLGIMHIFLQS